MNLSMQPESSIPQCWTDGNVDDVGWKAHTAPFIVGDMLPLYWAYHSYYSFRPNYFKFFHIWYFFKNKFFLSNIFSIYRISTYRKLNSSSSTLLQILTFDFFIHAISYLPHTWEPLVNNFFTKELYNGILAGDTLNSIFLLYFLCSKILTTFIFSHGLIH